MTDYYADSSVLVKRHVNEAGSKWFCNLVEPTAGNLIITARISQVEVYSALNRRQREANLSLTDYTQLAADFAAICAIEYQLVELTTEVVDRARLLLEQYSLRAYDAIQLASALLTNDILQGANLLPLVFLAADDRLIAVAQNEGLTIDNPNNHPD